MTENLKAMVLAAGVGSRLDPLTRQLPKPLIPVANRPVMEHILMWLAGHGVKKVASNLHYLPEKIRDHFSYKCTNTDMKPSFVHERILSGDCGGLRACRDFFTADSTGMDAASTNSTFVVVMGDIVTDVDLSHLVEEHKRSGALASIGLKRVDDVSQFGVACLRKDGFIDHFQEKPTAEEAQSDLANIGIYVFDSRIFNYIPGVGPYMFGKQLFPSLLEQGLPVRGVELDGYWSDIGTIASYKQTCAEVLSGKTTLSPRGATRVSANGDCVIRGNNVHIGANVTLTGNVTIGDNCVIASGATISDSILWANNLVGANAVIKDSVLAEGCRIMQNAHHEGDIIDQSGARASGTVQLVTHAETRERNLKKAS